MTRQELGSSGEKCRRLRIIRDAVIGPTKTQGWMASVATKPRRPYQAHWLDG